MILQVLTGYFRRRPATLFLLVAWMLALVASLVFLHQDHQRAVQALLDRSLSAQSISWSAVQTQQRYSVNTYVDEYVRDPETLALLRAALNPDQADQARQDLLEHLSPAYERLVERGVRQFHFHTPEGDSFLRFHHPTRFGDRLSDVRASIRIVNTELRPVFGFEIGRVVSGYRSVFPLLDEDGTHLGSVELSLPFSVLLSELRSLVPASHFQLLLDADRQRDILFDEQQPLYEPWTGSEDFLVEDPRGVLPDSPPVLPAEIQHLIAELGQRPDLIEKMRGSESKAVSLRVDGRDYAVLQSPVTDPGGEQVGILVSYLHEPELAALATGYYIRLSATWLVLLGLGAVLYLLLRTVDAKLGERAQLKVVSDTMGQGLYLSDADGRIVSMNPHGCELLGYEESFVVGRSAHNLFHTHRGNQFLAEERCPIRVAVLRGEEFRGEATFERSDGKRIEVMVVSRPLPSDGGHIGSVTVFEDITERKRMERDLAESRQRLANVLWSTGIGSWEWNVSTGQTRFDERWAEMLGYRLEDLEPTTIATWEQLLHPDDQAAAEKALQAHFAGLTEQYAVEFRMRHRAGHWVWILGSGRVLTWSEDGGPEWVVGTNLDISARKDAEQQSAELLQRLRKLGAELPGFVYQYWLKPDGSSAFVYASEGIEEIYGVTPEQVQSDAAPVFAVVHPDDVERVSADIAVSARELSVWRSTYRVNHPAKGLIWVEGQATPEIFDDGSVVWHGYIQDVTLRREAELRLENSEASYRTLVENAPVIIFRCETQPPWRMLQISRGAQRVCGHASSRLHSGDLVWGDLVLPEDLPMVEQEVEQAVKEARRYEIEYRIRHEDGSARWVSEIGSYRRSKTEDEQGCLEGVITDITQRRQAEQAAGEARALLNAALENSPSGILIADTDSARIRFANEAARRLLGGFPDQVRPHSDEAAAGQAWRVLDASGEVMPQERLPLQRALSDGEVVAGEEAIIERADGSRQWITIAAAPVENEQGQISAAIVVFSDISEQKATQAELRRRAHYDALTGLPNRVLLADRMEQAMQRARRSGQLLAVAFIDLDQFKPINDTHGHDVGDQLLIALSERMRSTLREVDTLARLGGDEFVAVLSGLDSAADSDVLLQRLIDAVSHPVEIDDLCLHVTGSIGMTFYPQDEELDADQLLRQADQAMYQAKLKGRNRWHFFSAQGKAESSY